MSETITVTIEPDFNQVQFLLDTIGMYTDLCNYLSLVVHKHDHLRPANLYYWDVDDNHQKVFLRSASDYAKQLNVHVNHLNRAVKEITEKTTSQVITERFLQEAKILLKHSAWSVSEIAYALGFTEVTHFNNFFKKHVEISPLKFRNV